MKKIKQRFVVVVGPTASGKSDLGIKIARKFNGEIISADSRQVYRGMDIGTGKVTRQDQKLVKHWLLDVADPKRQFTASHYKRLAQKAIANILHRGKIPIIVGGTGLYIDILVYNLPLPEVKPNPLLRAQFDKLTVKNLFDKLRKLDPRRTKTIDRHNKRRLIRALEIVLSTKSPVPILDTRFYSLDSPHDTLWLGITLFKEKLAQRIKKRLDSRLKAGMIAETKRLHAQGLSWKRLESFGLEYKWIALYLQKKMTRKEMYTRLLHAIIQYSKRQMTWFKRNKNIHWIKDLREAQKKTAQFLGS